MNRERTPQYFRLRAAQMQQQADKAPTDQLRESYLMIAADWERLAREMEGTISPSGLAVGA